MRATAGRLPAPRLREPRATAEKPNQAYEAGKFLQKEGAVQVQIHDAATGKIYDLPAFAKEHRLK